MNLPFFSQPGQADIQSDLFYDYRTNVDAYPKWQAWMREKQPRLLVIWGKYELSFDPSEPEAYRRDVPNAEVHIVDGGHFALDTAADEIARVVQELYEVAAGNTPLPASEKSKQCQTHRKPQLLLAPRRGIGAGAVAAFLQRGYSVMANSRNITKSNPFPASANLALVDGDIGDPKHGRRQLWILPYPDSAGLTHSSTTPAYISRSTFTDYTVDDLRSLVSVNIDGFVLSPSW